MKGLSSFSYFFGVFLMIANLIGNIFKVGDNSLIIDVNGTGYEVFLSSSNLSELEEGEQVSFLIYTEVREDSITLYGFNSELEKKVFILLKTVKGVAAKSAAEILSQVSAPEIINAIENANYSLIQSVKGIGKKTAERVILELKDKVGSLKFTLKDQLIVTREGESKGDESIIADVLSALVALGFSRKDSEDMISKFEKSIGKEKFVSLSAGEIVSEALQYS